MHSKKILLFLIHSMEFWPFLMHSIESWPFLMHSMEFWQIFKGINNNLGQYIYFRRSDKYSEYSMIVFFMLLSMIPTFSELYWANTSLR